MDKEQNSLRTASRINRKDKQRKVNKVYNISIAVVSLLILIVAITIFFGKSGAPQTEKAASTENKSATQSAADNKDKDPSKDSKQDSGTANEGQTQPEQNSPTVESQDQNATENPVVQAPAAPKVKEPAGTSQTGPHTTSFQKGSVDWNEMTAVMASATGIDPANMTVWWLGNGGAPNTAQGTVSAKNDSKKKYKVQLQWEDGAGWKPVKVE